MEIVQKRELLNITAHEIMVSFTGSVINGQQIGRKIGFPTANLSVGQDVGLARGVYGVIAEVDSRTYTGVINIGVKPTFRHQAQTVHYEVHLFDFAENIYGKQMRVNVCFFVREEKTFAGIDELIAQIWQDVNEVRRRFERS
ncbi:MAG: riboflavin kinase [Clostridia bacterium]